MATNQKPGKGVTEFREKYDKGYTIPKKIKEGLKDLGDGWMKEAEFCKHYTISQTDFAKYKLEFIDAHTIPIENGKRLIWCGTKKFRDQLLRSGDE